MSDKKSQCEIALDEFIESGALATNMCPNFLRDAYFKAGFNACTERAIDKRKFLEWMESEGYLEGGDFPRA